MSKIHVSKLNVSTINVFTYNDLFKPSRGEEHLHTLEQIIWERFIGLIILYKLYNNNCENNQNSYDKTKDDLLRICTKLHFHMFQDNLSFNYFILTSPTEEQLVSLDLYCLSQKLLLSIFTNWGDERLNWLISQERNLLMLRLSLIKKHISIEDTYNIVRTHVRCRMIRRDNDFDDDDDDDDMNDDDTNKNNLLFIKTRFNNVPTLVANRKVYLKLGDAYIDSDNCFNIFTRYTLNKFQFESEALHESGTILSEDIRFQYIINRIDKVMNYILTIDKDITLSGINRYLMSCIDAEKPVITGIHNDMKYEISNEKFQGKMKMIYLAFEKTGFLLFKDFWLLALYFKDVLHYHYFIVNNYFQNNYCKLQHLLNRRMNFAFYSHLLKHIFLSAVEFNLNVCVGVTSLKDNDLYYERANDTSLIKENNALIRKIFNNYWLLIQELLGPARFWPVFIRRAFWLSDCNDHIRMLLVNFAVLNGLNESFLHTVLTETLKFSYTDKRRRQVTARFKYFFNNEENRIIKLAKAYSYNTAVRRVIYLNGKNKDK